MWFLPLVLFGLALMRFEMQERSTSDAKAWREAESAKAEAHRQLMKQAMLQQMSMMKSARTRIPSKPKRAFVNGRLVTI